MKNKHLQAGDLIKLNQKGIDYIEDLNDCALGRTTRNNIYTVDYTMVYDTIIVKLKDFTFRHHLCLDEVDLHTIREATNLPDLF